MSNPSSCGPGAISTLSSWVTGNPIKNGLLSLAAVVMVCGFYLTLPADSPKCDIKGHVSSDGSQVGFTPDNGQTAFFHIDPNLGLAGQDMCFVRKGNSYHFAGAEEKKWRAAWNDYLASIA